MEKSLGHQAEVSPFDHAKHMRESVLPAMNELRKSSDKIESTISDDLWPLPTYREMLFIK